MRILKPESEEEINWIAEAHEEVGRISIRNYHKTQESIREVAQRIKDWLNDNSYRILIAYDELDNISNPVAMIVARIQKSPLDGEMEAFVESLYVKPSMRRQGLGRRLMEEVCEWGEKNKATRVKAYVSSTNTNMIGLCKRLGYRESFVTLERDI